jgi:hypothetical protein
VRSAFYLSLNRFRSLEYAPNSLLLLEIMLSFAGTHMQYATMIHSDRLQGINSEDLEETATSLPYDSG